MMRKLKYIGAAPYKDPRLRFVANKGDVIEFANDEATLVRQQHPRIFQEVKPDAPVRNGSGRISPDDSSGNSIR